MKKNMPVSEIMTRHVTTITPNTTVAQIKVFFDKNNFHHLPVIDDGKLVGIVSKMDIFKVTSSYALFRSKEDQDFNNRLMKSVLAEEIMNPQVVVLSPNDTVAEAAALFSKNKYHALPVVDDRKFVGIVTTYDLLEYAYHDVMLPILL
jgi:CBS domain-containing protein